MRGLKLKVGKIQKNGGSGEFESMSGLRYYGEISRVARHLADLAY